MLKRVAGLDRSSGDSRVGRDAGADRAYRLLVLADVWDDPDPQLHRTLIDSVLLMQADILDLAAFESAAGAVSTR
ncbi:hypothetical protein [Streptomyces sp. KHY 26]|uniref:hypothetical protein n=1 Tax=Streptomyces sp. KHY 26 TaxID=3097359 RepID=UPI00376F326D